MTETCTHKHFRLYVMCFYVSEDPVRIFDHEPAPPHSLVKLFLDLFSKVETANLFYTNDVKVLIDIIVRNISDLSPGDKVMSIIILISFMLENTGYPKLSVDSELSI